MDAGRRLVHQAIADRARACPAATAVIHDETRLMFSELDSRANQLAHLLCSRGVGPEVLVGVCVRPGPDLIIALLGVLKSGGAYVPLDSSAPTERLRWILADSGAAVALTRQPFPAPIGDDRLQVINLEAMQSHLAAQPATDPQCSVDPDNLAYVIYTSGSTGRPKAVQITHAGLANYLSTAVRDYCGDSAGGAPLLSTVSCDLMVPVLYATLMSGQPVRVLPDDVDLGRLGPTLTDAGPFDFIKLTPSHLGVLSRQLSLDQINGLAGTLIVGGEALPGTSVQPWVDHLGGRVINSYGPTEATVGTTAHTVTGRVQSATVPIGRPIPGVMFYVLDRRNRPVPTGVTGELHIGGAGLARGYGGQPGLTAERFVPNPFGPPGSRLYRTGDLARLLPDGSIDFIGRTDMQVKIRGHRVETGEVEHALIRLPQVAAALVVPYETAPGDRKLLAYVVPEGTNLDIPALRAELGRTLPEHMIPGIFVRLDALPLTANGKVDRAALPDPAQLRPTADPTLAEETTELQRTICEVWAKALFVEHVGVQDNFFDLGGDSLSAVRVMFQLQQEHRIDVSVHTLYAAPTVAELALAIDTTATPGVMRRTPLKDGEVAR
jgi:amino acid adenylation domain-containing protein